MSEVHTLLCVVQVVWKYRPTGTDPLEPYNVPFIRQMLLLLKLKVKQSHYRPEQTLRVPGV